MQLSTLDLQQEIQEALESNPLLDVEEGNDDTPANSEEKPSRDEKETAEATAEPDLPDSSDLIEKSEIGNDLEIDTTWGRRLQCQHG